MAPGQCCVHLMSRSRCAAAKDSLSRIRREGQLLSRASSAPGPWSEALPLSTTTTMVKYHSISAWVNVEGVPLPEYSEEVITAENKVICWIPSEAGKVSLSYQQYNALQCFQEFTVNVRHERATLDTGSYLYVDGKLVSGRSLPFGSQIDTISIGSLATSATTARSLMFASLQLTDDDGLLGSAVSNELGEIRVEHWHVMLGASLPFTPTAYTDTGLVHERSKKAISHRTRYAYISPSRRASTEQHYQARGTQNHELANTERGYSSSASVDCYISVSSVGNVTSKRNCACATTSTQEPPAVASGSKKRGLSPDADVVNISDEDSEDESARIAKLEAELARLRSGKKSNKKVKREQEVKQEKIVLDPNDIVDVT
ncbi:hypothetical protein BDZ89DRAFT_839425 [Hymenopellis radicata]|nr:hypothetical protein BDZ89DRAFT_839425 [Hymenopellis radicata]